MNVPEIEEAADSDGCFEPRGHSTEAIYSVPLPGDERRRYYSAVRGQRIHDALIAQHLGHVSPSDRPFMILTGGGPASGKGAVALRLEDANKAGRLAILDADIFKKGLPEYNQLIGDGRKDEAADMATRLPSSSSIAHPK